VFGSDSTAPPFLLHALGPFARDRVVSTFDGLRMATNAETRALIEAAWISREAEASARGQLLFAGPMCRLHALSVRDDELALSFGPTNYRELVGTNLSHPEFGSRFGDEFLSNGTGVCAAIETVDHKLVVQRRGARVFEHPGRLHVCGGAVEPQSNSGNAVADPFATIEREMAEELGILPSEITEMRCLGLARDGATHKPEVLLHVRIDRTARQIAEETSAEHTALHIIDADPASLSGWMTDHWTEIAPIGLACLTAYLACRFASGLASSWQVSR
jgi:8-oxo-dGTP pyrophosphatase MutT (NUDIX family)